MQSIMNRRTPMAEPNMNSVRPAAVSGNSGKPFGEVAFVINPPLAGFILILSASCSQATFAEDLNCLGNQ